MLVAAATSCSAAFVLPTGKTMPSSSNPKINTSRETTTSLEAALLPSIVTKLSPPLRNTIVLSTAASAVAVSIYRSHKKKGLPDANFSEPLPEGNLGCPILGNIDFYTNQGSVETGPGDFFRRQAAKAKNKNIFRYMAFGKPIVMVSGMKNVKSAFNQEFKKIRTTSLMTRLTDLFGGESMLFVNEADRHQYMRRLVGQSMTPDKINLAIPALVASATEQLDQLTMEEPVTMEHVCTNFTLDVAWRQILGLDLKEDEIVQFYEAVDNWIGGIVDLRTLLMPSIKHTKAGKGNAYLVSKIERKMDQLERDGPDGSTMSAMYFARDEEDPSKCLSRDDVISNALLLISAGSETAASTLTVSALALGLHKNVLKKLKDEQLAMIDKHGTEEMTREMIEKDCPYLDVVIKETMRIKPLGTGAMRVADETIVVDGTQIPKGNGVVFNIYLTHEGDPVVKEDGNAHMDIVKGFKPERWLDDSTKPTEYMPFGYGPRFCLGYNLAMAEMKVFLALLARRVDFNLVNMNQDNVTWKKASIIPKPEDGAVVELASLS
jgi:cytochrome P450